MKVTILPTVVLFICGCASQPMQTSSEASAATCIGSTALTGEFNTQFKPVEDEALLQQAIGQPNEGKLCQGQVYQSNEVSDVFLYRAWNSTNPNSQLGHWWAFQMPDGQVAAYRSDYEICYQWSPLDKLVHCRLKPGAKVVVGNGQSAVCSEYLAYPVSETQQVYIEDAASVLTDCEDFSGVFSWQ